MTRVAEEKRCKYSIFGEVLSYASSVKKREWRWGGRTRTNVARVGGFFEIQNAWGRFILILPLFFYLYTIVPPLCRVWFRAVGVVLWFRGTSGVYIWEFGRAGIGEEGRRSGARSWGGARLLRDGRECPCQLDFAAPTQASLFAAGRRELQSTASSLNW